jgi:hypothetical protein
LPCRPIPKLRPYRVRANLANEDTAPEFAAFFAAGLAYIRGKERLDVAIGAEQARVRPGGDILQQSGGGAVGYAQESVLGAADADRHRDTQIFGGASDCSGSTQIFSDFTIGNLLAVRHYVQTSRPKHQESANGDD